MIGESSAVLRCLPTPSKAEPRAFARRCEPQTRAPTRGRAGVSCVEHVYESPGMVRLCGADSLGRDRHRSQRKERGPPLPPDAFLRPSRALSRGVVSRPTRAPTRGRAGVSCVEHVYESPVMVRLCGAAALDATGIGHSERSAVLRCLPTPSEGRAARSIARVVSIAVHARLLGDAAGVACDGARITGPEWCRLSESAAAAAMRPRRKGGAEPPQRPAAAPRARARRRGVCESVLRGAALGEAREAGCGRQV